MAKIKFALRRNLIYLMQYIIWSFLRVILTMLIKHIFEFGESLIYSPLIFIGETVGGLIIYLYQRKFKKKKGKEKEERSMSIELIKNEVDYNDYFIPVDNNIKILFLIFITAFLDWVYCLNTYFYLPKFIKLSSSLSTRLSGFTTIFSSFFYLYTLKFPIYKHHKLSLLIIGICLLIMIILEYYYQKVNIFINYIDMTKAIALIIISNLLISCGDSIEKYLFEFDYMDPFVVLIYEGIFGFILTLLFFINGRHYIHDIKDFYNKNSSAKFTLFVFLLILYVFLSAGKNIFRVVINKIYSPMAESLTEYFLNPIYILYYYGALDDFTHDKILNIPYFIINLFLSIII